MKNILLSGTPVSTTVVVSETQHCVTLRPVFKSRIGIIEQAPSYPALVGKMVMPRWPIQAERRAMHTKTHLRFSATEITNIVYADAYELQRALSHALDRYESTEIPQLTTAVEYCTALHGVFLGLRRDTYEELIERIEALVQDIVRVLGIQVRNPEKKNVITHAVKVRTGTDSLNRVNSGMACLRMLTAVSDLIERESTTANISAVYACRRQAVRLLLATLETQVLIIEDFLQQILCHWLIVRNRRRELTMAQLEQFIFVIQPVVVLPFGQTFRHIVREFTGAITCIRNRKVDDARPLLETAAASLRLRKLRVQLERVHYVVASVQHNPSARKHSAGIAKQSAQDLHQHIEELGAVSTIGMVDFPREFTLSTLREAQSALHAGNCVTAADNLRLALRAL